MDIKELLPIGSIVLLEGGQKRLMIFGVKQSNMETGEEYDYIAVPYPEGNMGTDGQFLFNHGDIEEVIFRGFEDEEREGFLDRMEQFYAQNGSV